MTQCNNKPYTIMHAGEIEVDMLESLPDFFFAVRTLTDTSTDSTIYTPSLVPGEKLFPNGANANTTAITTNNDSLVIPEDQVRAGYVDVRPGGNVVRLTDSNNAPMFVLVKNYTNGKVLIQTTGFLQIPAGHQYIVGETYYDDGEGLPTTDSATGRKLFHVIDGYTLAIHGDF